MSSDAREQRTATIANADENLLAELGYKQEFQRAFTPLEVYYVIITYVISLIYSMTDRKGRWAPVRDWMEWGGVIRWLRELRLVSYLCQHL
jgi:hypothetical protein